MKILFISAFPPNSKTAGQDYSHRLILDLVNRGHDVSLVYACYTWHDVEVPKSVKIIRTITPSLFNCLNRIDLHPIFTRRFSKAVLSTVQKIAGGFDVLYFDFSQVHVYSLYVNHPQKILMCHDVMAQKYTRKNRIQLPCVKRSEQKILSSAAYIITFSEKDVALIKHNYALKAHSVNFYLKTSRFSFESVKVEHSTFCFYGAWNRSENLCALKEFLKTAYGKLPCGITIKIIGGGLSKKEVEWISRLNNVSYLGFVENPIAEIAKCQALIAPLKTGAGVKMKVIDALSCGTPVIGTDIAFEGVVDNEKHKLFHTAKNTAEIMAILKTWNEVTAEYKQNAADEFFRRYDTNHFPDLLADLAKGAAHDHSAH